MREDRLPRRADERQAVEIGLAEPQQEPGNRQDGDRQHQRPTEWLERAEDRFHAGISRGAKARASART